MLGQSIVGCPLSVSCQIYTTTSPTTSPYPTPSPARTYTLADITLHFDIEIARLVVEHLNLPKLSSVRFQSTNICEE